MKKIISQFKQGKNFLSFMGFKTIAQGLSLILPLIIAKILSPDLFGSFSLFKMILFFGTSVFIGPLMAPLNIESNKEYSKTGKSNKTFTSSLVYFLSSISIFLIIFFFFGKELISFTGLEYEIYKNVFLLAFFGLGIKSFLSTFFMSQDNKKAHILVELIYNLSIISIILLFYYYNIFNLYNIFLSFFIASVIIFLVSLFFIDFKRIFPLNFSSSNFKIIRSFSLWVILGATSSYLINWGDNLVLRYFVSLEEIGIYNFAYQIFKGFVMVSLMINTYFTPFVAKNIDNKNKLKDYYFNKRPKILLFSLSFIIISNIIIYFIIIVFYKNYIDSFLIINLLSIAALCTFYYSFLIPIYNSFNLYKITQIMLIFQVSLNLILNLFLIPHYGIIGTALSTVLAYILFTIAFDLFFRKKILIKLI